MTGIPDARLYAGYADLAKAQVRGRDFEIQVQRQPASPIAVIAPHGGGIEDGTSEIARAIARDDFNLYLFEGLRPSRNYAALHLTSHLFDEPECLDLLSGCHYVLAVHGCDGDEHRALLGGLDTDLRDEVAAALGDVRILAESEGHRFPAVHPANICNRGLRRRGVQLELTHPMRRQPHVTRLASAVRSVLLPRCASHRAQRGRPPDRPVV